MTTYRGFDVLEINPNRNGTGKVDYNRLAQLADNKTGKRTYDDRAGVSIPTHSFSWFASSKAEIAALKVWIAARKGQAVPFWIPTYSRDLILASDIQANDSAIVVQDTSYVRFMFPYISRQHIALIKTDGTFLTRQVTTAINNGDGTETLTLNSNIPYQMLAANTLVSYLVLCRLADDDAPIHWHNLSHAEANFSFVEIPKETPA